VADALAARQASKLGDSLRSILARQFLHLAENFGAPTRIAALAFTKFHFLLSVNRLFSGKILDRLQFPLDD
jgi:hypothetical protein